MSGCPSTTLMPSVCSNTGGAFTLSTLTTTVRSPVAMPSLTTNVICAGPALSNAGVHSKTPVIGFSVAPGGRFGELKRNVAESGSVARRVKRSGSPWRTVRSGMPSSTGATFVGSTIMRSDLVVMFTPSVADTSTLS